MCNGLTLARHCLMGGGYENTYPRIRDPEGKEYYGNFKTDQFHLDLGMTVGEALLSPTRLFSPLLKGVLAELGEEVHGVVHNTGGGQTKCLRLGRGVRYVKDNLPEPDPIFRLIQSASGEEWKDMYGGFNMGMGMDVIVPERLSSRVIEVAGQYGVGAQRTGYVEQGEKGLLIASRWGTFSYP